MDYKAEWRIRTRRWAMDVLGGVCAQCGVGTDLDFDHIDAQSKSFDISVGIRDGYSKVRLLDELEKCQLLCRRHNMDKSIRLREHAGGRNKIHNPAHGTCVCYTRLGCRCAKCREWRRLYRTKIVDAQGNLRM